MFEQVVQWFRKLFGGETSSSVAKDRLRLVLLSDHLALAPDVIESLRRDLLDVISRYVEVDEAHSDVSFEHKEAGVAMLASIPILAMRARELLPDPPPEEKTEARSPEEETGVLEAVSPNGHSDNYGRRPRKRRRRKTSGASQTAPAQ